MPPNSPLHRVCLAQQIRDSVADRIARGEYPPGYRLVELGLAREFGTSQGPVRESLRMLEGMGLVEVVPHKGTRVRAMCDREQLEVCEVRAALEDMACTLAMAHFHRDADALNELRRLNGIFARAAKKKDLQTVAVSNDDFHRKIVKSCGNASLIAMWETTALRPRGIATQIQKGFDPTVSVEQHDGIIAALAAGDAELAGRRMREHALYFAKMYTCPDTVPDAPARRGKS
jgi:DNA-binding GntR family transcriptional regulator